MRIVCWTQQQHHRHGSTGYQIRRGWKESTCKAIEISEEECRIRASHDLIDATKSDQRTGTLRGDAGWLAGLADVDRLWCDGLLNYGEEWFDCALWAIVLWYGQRLTELDGIPQNWDFLSYIFWCRKNVGSRGAIAQAENYRRTNGRGKGHDMIVICIREQIGSIDLRVAADNHFLQLIAVVNWQ